MRGGFPAVLILLGLLNGSGPAGGLPLRKGRAVDCVSWVRSRGWLVCLVIGVGNTPAAALLGGGGCPRVRWCVWGWHAVGVLGQCALVAWPVWGS